MNLIGRKQPRSPIGLDLGARRIKAVQLEPSTTSALGWRVAAAACVSRSAPGAAVTSAELVRLGDTLERLGFVGNRVVLAAPADKLVSGMLELPKAGQIPLEQIARIELARNHKIAPESFEMGCWELPTPARAGKTVSVMAVGYPHADATHLLDQVESAGFDAVAMDVRSCALARACAGVATPPPGITAMLDLGWSSASLVLVHAGVVIYVRALGESGMGRVHEALAKRLRLEPELTDYLIADVGLREPGAAGAAAADRHDGADHSASDDRPTLPSDARSLLTNYADGLVRELLVSFSYVARQYTDASVARLLLMGTAGSIPGLAEHLSKELGVDTRAVAPADMTECPPGLLEACAAPELTPAFGLAQFPDT